MKRTLALVAATLALLAAGSPRVAISLRPRAVLRGGAFWLSCRVPADPRNRLLEYGLAGYTMSQRDLEGDQARVTWEVLMSQVPCDVGPAYCAVRTDDGRWTRVEAPLVIAGCEDE